MRLILQKVRFKNFFAFGNQWCEIQLDTPGTTLVAGKNGSGKSSAMLDAVSFALFNKPFRKINKPQLTNSINKKNCLVELDFMASSHQYKVRRGLNPAIFQIIKNGELVTETPDNRDYQNELEKYILHINYKTFCQLVILGKARDALPFMALPAAARRLVIEDLLDLQIFSIMNTLLKGRIDGVEELFNEKTHEKKLIEERLRLTEEHFKEMQTSWDDEIQLLFDRQIRNNHQEEDLEIEKIHIKESLETLYEGVVYGAIVNKRYDEITKLKYQLTHKAEQGLKEIAFLKNHDDCPTCHQVIEQQFRVNTIIVKEKDVSIHEVAIKELDKELYKVQGQLSAIETAKEQIREYNNKLREISVRIEMYEKENKQLGQEINKLTNKSKCVDISKLDDVKEQLQVVESDLKTLADDRMMMRHAASILKDSGIKAKIIKTFIPVINQLINKNLAALDFFVKFELTEEIEEVIKSRYRDDFSYESFSEGEKMRLDIAILCAWRALAKLRGSVDCNFLVLDELLDSSLDQEGLDDAMKLISNLTNGENIFVISHKIDQLGDRFSRVIRFQKERNFSKMVAA